LGKLRYFFAVNVDINTALTGDFRVEWAASPRKMDEFWAAGWRHFGPFFFRRYFMEYGEELKSVQPLRFDLDEFRLSKSQRRVLRRNGDLRLRIGPTVINDALRAMFAAHVQRFTFNVPPSLESFLGVQPDTVPCENVTLALYRGEHLIAASFLDLGKEAASSIYGIFDPAESRRSLGILTMLKEIGYARQRGCRYYYPGYACHESSPYDYKKQFFGMEWYDWQGGWHPLERQIARRWASGGDLACCG
jgi:arginyl-tRNA--protein-N-Asp/Glu arginylyltransferase